jgi:hypothetical protein
MEGFMAEDITNGMPKPPLTAFGLDLVGVSDDDVGVPLEALCILKCYKDGEPGYIISSTSTLTTVEGVGMLEWAKNVFLQSSLLLGILDNSPDSTEDDEEKDE